MTDVIRDLPIDERPREKMYKHGPGVLSNAELGAILIGSGTSGVNAIQLARLVLREGGGNYAKLRKHEPAEFEHIHGVGRAKLARLWAGMEIGWRVMNQEPVEREQYELATVGRALVKQYGQERQERLGAVLLDARHRILKQHEIYVGTINTALVATRDIICSTLLENAVAIVLFHNHPSGSPIPSQEDIDFTAKLRDILPKADIDFHDHVIIGEHGYYSMRERGFLP